MKNRCILLFLIIISFSASLSAQDTIKREGKLTVHVDKKVDEYLQQRRQNHLNDSQEKGYRIQIIFTDKRQEAREAKEKFKNMFPDCPAYDMYDSPHFKVRVGDFRTRLEAQALLFKLEEEFPTLLLIEDKINPPSLIPCY